MQLIQPLHSFQHEISLNHITVFHGFLRTFQNWFRKFRHHSELLIQKSGTHMIAKDRHATFPQLERIAHTIKGTDIAYFTTDTLNANAYDIRCSFNYLHTFTFSLLKSDKSWFISEIKE